jgi:hypothetical protein
MTQRWGSLFWAGLVTTAKSSEEFSWASRKRPLLNCESCAYRYCLAGSPGAGCRCPERVGSPPRSRRRNHGRRGNDRCSAAESCMYRRLLPDNPALGVVVLSGLGDRREVVCVRFESVDEAVVALLLNCGQSRQEGTDRGVGIDAAAAQHADDARIRDIHIVASAFDNLMDLMISEPLSAASAISSDSPASGAELMPATLNGTSRKCD